MAPRLSVYKCLKRERAVVYLHIVLIETTCLCAVGEEGEEGLAILRGASTRPGWVSGHWPDGLKRPWQPHSGRLTGSLWSLGSFDSSLLHHQSTSLLLPLLPSLRATLLVHLWRHFVWHIPPYERGSTFGYLITPPSSMPL